VAKLLNSFRFHCPVYTTEPEGFRFTVGGKHFCIDSNSLALWELDTPDETVELCPVKPQFQLSPARQVGMLVLESTNACNYRCKYCFNEAYDDRTGRMSFDTACQAIKTTMPKESLGRGSRAPHIGFFGGEPMMNWDLVGRIVPFAQGYFHPLVPSFSMTTNASLVTPEKALYLKENGFSFIVSVDGPEELHDELRVYKGGKGTFKDTMAGLKALADAGVERITLRATFVPGKEHLLEKVVFLNELCDQGMGNWVSVEPVCLTESHCISHDYGSLSSYTKETAAQLEDQYLEVARWGIGRLKEEKPFRFHNEMKPIERLLHTRHSPSECGAGCGYMSVSYDGSVWACHRMNWGRIGNLFGGGIDEESRAKWSDNRLYSRKGCLDCGVRWMCGGGCREASLGAHRDITKPFEVSCAFMKIWIKIGAYIISEIGQDELKKLIPDPGRLRAANKNGVKGVKQEAKS